VQAFGIAKANNIKVENQIMGAQTQEDEELAVHLQNGERMGNGRGTEELFRHVR
jgi:hypothetical protein